MCYSTDQAVKNAFFSKEEDNPENVVTISDEQGFQVLPGSDVPIGVYRVEKGNVEEAKNGRWTTVYESPTA